MAYLYCVRACRIRSIAIANRQLEAEGRERITRIRCEEFRGSASKAELFTLTGNSNALSVVAEALSIKRLVEDEEPKTFAELAKKRGKSEQHLRQMVRVLDPLRTTDHACERSGEHVRCTGRV